MTIGEQIWNTAVAKLAVSAEPLDMARYVHEVFDQLRGHIIAEVDKLDASYRCDLDAMEEHYRQKAGDDR